MHERGSTPAWLPVVVALGAMAVALLAILKKPDEATESRDLDIASLETRIEGLEESMRRVETRLGNGQVLRAPPAPAPRRAPPPQPSGKDLEARMAELEKKMAADGGKPADKPAVSLGDILRKKRAAEGDGKGPEALQKLAMDRGAAAYQRLQALRRLRGIRDGRSREVVLSMMQLYRESDEPKIRADIFRQLSKVKQPELRDTLIEALRSDADAKVREEAAETLGIYRDDPAARDALEHSAENDADKGVRKEAKDALAGER